MNIRCYFNFHSWEYYDRHNMSDGKTKGRVCKRCLINQHHFYSFFLPEKFKPNEDDPNWTDAPHDDQSKKMINRIRNLNSILK